MNISFLSDSVTFQRGEKSDLVAEMGRFFQQKGTISLKQKRTVSQQKKTSFTQKYPFFQEKGQNRGWAQSNY